MGMGLFKGWGVDVDEFSRSLEGVLLVCIVYRYPDRWLKEEVS